MDADRLEALAVVRAGYALARGIAVKAGVTHADEDAAGGPAATFAALANALGEAASTAPGTAGARNMLSDGVALAMLCDICTTHGFAWAEVRGGEAVH